MEFQSYNEELAVANLLFKKVFSNIRIGRTNDQGEEKQILVQCSLGQRSRILKNIANPERRGNYKLPMIVINRTGYTRNGDRLNNMNNEVKYELTSAYRKYHLMPPVPIDITYDVTVIAKYPSDIDKIASNFMVFFNSDIYVSCEHPKYQGVKLNNQVIMSDSVSEDHPDELDATQDDITTATFNFTFKTYLFAGTKKAQLIKPKILSSYVSSFVQTVIEEISPDQIDEFQKNHPNQSVSAMFNRNVTSQITSYVDNPDVSADIYDDMPYVNKIDFGVYVVPKKYDIQEYIQSVDNGDFGSHYNYDVSGYISSLSYMSSGIDMLSDPYVSSDVANGYPLSICEYGNANKPLSTIDDYYDKVDWNCSLAPYVDRLYWRIDGDIIMPDGKTKYEFPNNVKWERD